MELSNTASAGLPAGIFDMSVAELEALSKAELEAVPAGCKTFSDEINLRRAYA